MRYAKLVEHPVLLMQNLLDDRIGEPSRTEVTCDEAEFFLKCRTPLAVPACLSGIASCELKISDLGMRESFAGFKRNGRSEFWVVTVLGQVLNSPLLLQTVVRLQPSPIGAVTLRIGQRGSMSLVEQRVVLPAELSGKSI